MVVDLVALPIIIVPCRQQDSATITALAVCGPDFVNGQEFICHERLLGAVDVHRPAVLGLSRVRVGNSHMSILLVSQRDMISCLNFQTRKAWGVDAGNGLRGLAEEVGVEDCVRRAAVGGEEVGEYCVGE